MDKGFHRTLEDYDAHVYQFFEHQNIIGFYFLFEDAYLQVTCVILGQHHKPVKRHHTDCGTQTEKELN